MPLPPDLDLLHELEAAMWQTDTRADRQWFSAHIADDFVEFGQSGRIYDRQAIFEDVAGNTWDLLGPRP